MIIPPAELTLFIAITVIAVLTPGPDILYILSHSAGHRKSPGIIASLGITTGLLVHTTAVAIGLGELFIHSPTAFTILKWIGASYLLYLAFGIIRTQSDKTKVKTAAPISDTRIYFRGFFVNVLNPKAFMYFISILPQFVDSNLGFVKTQLFTLAFIDIVLGLIIFCILSLSFNYVSKFLNMEHPTLQFLKKYGLAFLFSALAVKLVF